ncbi:UDP-glucose/GDP-mannose dehydrogenase family protein [Lentzea sp. NEAU-D13]|uniref:UDP-glucose 6-dehydrogenase n=1 Tax=Lentzea alba TaxID=2714351 RepID=A0A7C9RRM2_9PSEU|nr:UDP-glucose/GDP-mannose dehydrogenase family protein [Lentzea alba]NGY61765.1 UDP-glucose/GDP-mannose dehydrogenase family protein [Lentzea alba]
MFVRRVAVVGAGYVGLTSAACLASLGHHVVCADIDEKKVEQLRKAEVQIFEPGLTELVGEGIAAGRLEFVVGVRNAVPDAEVVFLCVPTPMGEGGAADLRAVEAAVAEMKDLLAPETVVVNKSTVPVGTAKRVLELLDRDDVFVASNPEFLREGSAVKDFMHPDRIVVGSDAQNAAERVSALYARLGAPTVLMDAASAELVKYSANCFLAMKLSYVNAMAELCERLGADIANVTEGMGFDQRIGQSFLQPGPGWGGSCLPKDTHALLQIAEAAGHEFELLQATINTNEKQSRLIISKIAQAVGGLRGKKLGLLGLAFKAGTNDLRDSPALKIAKMLKAEGAELVAYDPAIPAEVEGVTDDVTVVDDVQHAAKDANALVVLTEWPQFRSLDWAALAGAMTGQVVVDTRNLLDGDILTRAGLTSHGVGR